MVPLEYLNNFWRTLKMSLIKSEINLILTSSVNCVISNAPLNRATLFAITDTKLYAPVVTLSIQETILNFLQGTVKVLYFYFI